MDRLLLLMTTTTYRASAFLEAASRLKVPVVVGTDQRQVLEAANPGGNLTLDFLDPERAIRSIVEFDRQYPIRAVVAADDDGVILGAMASQTLGLSSNSVEAARAARNKFRMRQVLAEAGLPSPPFHRIFLEENPEDVARRVAYPCVLKPLFLAGSRGVIRADDPPEFVAAFHRIAALLRPPEVAAQGGALAQQILVEGYIPGDEVALEGLLVHGRLKVLALFDKPDPLDGPFFEETIYVTPSRLPAAIQERIAACTTQAVKAIGLNDGPVHAELRLNEQGEWIIEVAPRSIGGLCSRSLRFGEGVSLEEVILRHAMGLEVDSFDREKRAAGVMMVPIPHAGILREIQGKEEAEATPGVEEIRLTIPVGQELIPLPEGKRYLGFIFARGGTPEVVESALREAHRRLTFIIAPPGKTWINGSGLAEVELQTSSTGRARERLAASSQGT